MTVIRLLIFAAICTAAPLSLQAQTDPPFGDDSGPWSGDGECDDPRFQGAGMAEDLAEVNLMRDATDCGALFRAGNITLRPFREITESGTLADGDGKAPTGSWRDTISFEGATGDRVTVDLQSGQFDSLLTVRTPGGTVHENDDYEGDISRSRVSFVMTEDGTYEADVTSFGEGSTGDYTLSIRFNEPVEPPRPAQPLEGAVSGMLESGDESQPGGGLMDRYSFEASLGETVTVDLRSDAFDTMLRVRTPSGGTQENDDFEGDIARSSLVLEIDETGTYEVQAASFGAGETGAYTLALTRGPGLDIVDRQEYEGRLEEGDNRPDGASWVDTYEYQAEAGLRLRIDLQSDSLDTYLTVTGPSGDSEANDDFDDVGHSRIEVNGTEAGPYRIQAASFGAAQEGDYKVTILAVRMSEEELAEASAPPVAPISQDPVPLSNGEVFGGELAATDPATSEGNHTDIYTFVARQGEAITFDLTSMDFDTVLRINTPNGETIENDDYEGDVGRSRIDIPAAAMGTYQIVVTSFDPQQTGSYSLGVEVTGQ